ncbi:methylated-DNA--[protein]-cysteine S-methyltransferase [Paenibacillus luteus]|uniref:methylated-DNA--[protein]-cysteine S-methyltransferase n=1 Tax=Paenibacillus luteus TaxID=2545753 RepID=UPI001142F5F7|nr:methylated-DNA--[protein]-cysteine S-methyltransferase [Paenibacillus luteus]
MRNELMWTRVEFNQSSWLLLATEKGLCRIIFPHEGLEHFKSWMTRIIPNGELKEDHEAIKRTGIIEWLEGYFAGQKLSIAGAKLDLIGTKFQQEVWRELGNIPYGETRSYGEIAKAINRPQAVRAVGAANGANPIPIVLPCHRVIGANRKLTGFRGGLEMKKKLLTIEGITNVEDGGHERFLF